MAWFGKSDEELKRWQGELENKENELAQKEHAFEEKSKSFLNQERAARETLERLSKRESVLFEREHLLAQREVDAKNSFVKQQREAFKEAIETRLGDLNTMTEELGRKQEEIEKEFAKLKQLEGELSLRERKVKEAEINAANGFADQNKTALRELERREKMCKQLEGDLKAREEEITNKQREYIKKNEALRVREIHIKESEIAREEGFSEERKKLDEELFQKRSDFLRELSEKRESMFEDLEKTIMEERERRALALQNELDAIRQQEEAAIQKEKNELRTLKENLLFEQSRINEQKEDLEFQKQRMRSRKDVLDEREANLGREVDVRVEERKLSFEQEKAALQDEIARVRESIKTSKELVSNFEDLKSKLGNEDPAVVLLKLKTYEEEIKRLRDELATRPTREMQDSFDRIKAEQDGLRTAYERLFEENKLLRESARAQSDLEVQIAELLDKNKSLQRRFDSVDADNNRLNEELKRLQASYEREQDRESRIRDIETPYIQRELRRAEENAITELRWLDGISASCVDYGLRFPRRILHAFHTALKTSEWSPITVLAGVSGTGKSELPRLYSHFGGMVFLSLPVQPNWDSQESMLGFFNSIDNKFDAQPVLRLLAQSQKTKSDDYPFGLKDVMCLILMDEMNLAHVELYFADFLSKLELRRGRKGSEVPCLEVKLGAGIQHYDLPLGRNILWSGTMNQDETTKALSDKVLDRGIVINFPRPTSLERRKQLKQLAETVPLLSRKTWESWWCRESKFSDEQITPFKGFIEEMNLSLSKVGRALGHRVWQSIEYYMSNYPEVMEAHKTQNDAALCKSMKTAFEDQLVQKVMPKLRGIETRGKSRSECLDKIRKQLVNDDYLIVEDFDLACEFGHGQFIWNSANYLKDDGQANNSAPEGGEEVQFAQI
jgi:hypothetical protein